MRKLRIILALPDFTARVDVPDAGRRQLREAHFSVVSFDNRCHFDDDVAKRQLRFRLF
jgi:hypothetical protein